MSTPAVDHQISSIRFCYDEKAVSVRSNSDSYTLGNQTNWQSLVYAITYIVSYIPSKPMAFDENMEPEIQRVLDTSAILEITEFEVFRLSYNRWFGTPANDDLIEPIFCDYMFRMVVPTWVNHFTRKVMKLYQEGQLDPTSYGIKPKPFSNAAARRGIQLAVIIAAVLICLILLAENATDFYAPTGIFR